MSTGKRTKKMIWIIGGVVLFYDKLLIGGKQYD